MTKDNDNLLADLASIEAMVRELSSVGKRSELKVRADKILGLVEMVRRKVHLREVENKKNQFTPNFATLWGGGKDEKGE